MLEIVLLFLSVSLSSVFDVSLKRLKQNAVHWQSDWTPQTCDWVPGALVPVTQDDDGGLPDWSCV